MRSLNHGKPTTVTIMTKKPLSVQARHVIWLSCKLVILCCVVLSFVAWFGLHFRYKVPSSSTAPFRCVVRSGGPRDNFKGPPKIAFLFLVRRELPLDFLWESFFENAAVANFSIHVHSAPGFVFDESTTRSKFFYDRQLSNSIQVAWGESSMIAAERLLLEAALEDPANQRFILVSDSCVPLYNFSYIYNYLMASPKSFVDSFLDGKEGRYHPNMSPVIPEDRWRKGSQWISLIRSHAEVIVDDEIILPVFKKLCKRRLPVLASKGKLGLKLKKKHNCIPDEHYVQTLLTMCGLESELERRTLTYTEWNQSATDMEDKPWHPTTFSYANAGVKQINEIKQINHIYHETEYRTEWCHINNTSVPCFLFARKFSRGAAIRLLTDGVVGPFEASASHLNDL